MNAKNLPLIHFKYQADERIKQNEQIKKQRENMIRNIIPHHIQKLDHMQTKKVYCQTWTYYKNNCWKTRTCKKRSHQKWHNLANKCKLLQRLSQTPEDTTFASSLGRRKGSNAVVCVHKYIFWSGAYESAPQVS